jgi:hypothetical protein
MILQERRAQPAVKAGRRGAGAARSAVVRPRLDGGEPGARLDGRDDEARDERHDVIPGLGRFASMRQQHRITLYPVGRDCPVP